MSIYDPDDDGLDDDNPYDYSNVNNEEAKEDIARMQLRQNRATEAEIIELLESLLSKYKEYLKVYNTSFKAKSLAFEKDIERYDRMIKDELLPDFLYHKISLHALTRAKSALADKRNFENEVDEYERDYNCLPFENKEQANKLLTYDVCPGLQANIKYLKFLEIFIDTAPKINFQNREKAIASKTKLDKAENKLTTELNKIIKTTEETFKYKQHLIEEYEKLKQNKSQQEHDPEILQRSNLMFKNIDNQLKTRLKAYLNYAPESKLKNEIKKVSSSGYFGINLNRNYITELFEKINDGTIKLDTPCQGE